MKIKKTLKKRRLPASFATIIYLNNKANLIDMRLDEFTTDLLFYREISFCSTLQIFNSLNNIRELIEKMKNEHISNVDAFDKYSKINKKIESLLLSNINHSDFTEGIKSLISQEIDPSTIKKIKGTCSRYSGYSGDEEYYYIKLCDYVSKKKLLRIVDIGLNDYLEEILDPQNGDVILLYRRKVISVLHYVYAALEKYEDTPLKEEIVKEVKILWKLI